MSRRLCDYHFELPDELIARHPLERREDSRMLVLSRETGEIGHRQFRDLPEYLRPGDLAVLNDTRVLRARLFSDDGRIELLLLEQEAAGTWKCLVKPGKRARVGVEFNVGGTIGRVRSIAEDGSRVVVFERELDLEKVGELPLPPYLKRAAETADAQRYQTVYARAPGAVAAPTAGLHFTPEILARIEHTFVTLHVGAGTFRPVKTADITEHAMHSERYALTAASVEKMEAARRILAVGTTSVRVLESAARAGGGLRAHEGRTEIFIYPGFAFRMTGALLTNFHLPGSTLLMLVSAFAGREQVLAAYREAVRERYRFYSYGDCMLIV